MGLINQLSYCLGAPHCVGILKIMDFSGDRNGLESHDNPLYDYRYGYRSHITIDMVTRCFKVSIFHGLIKEVLNVSWLQSGAPNVR